MLAVLHTSFCAKILTAVRDADSIQDWQNCDGMQAHEKFCNEEMGSDRLPTRPMSLKVALSEGL